MSISKTSIHTEVIETSNKSKNPTEKSSKDDMGGEMSRLPRDIVMEIFSRLSIKDLKQCVWVRRSWYEIIHTLDFTKIHHKKTAFRGTHTVSFIVHDLNVDDPDLPHDLYLVDYELSGDSVTSYGIVPLRTKFKEMNIEYELVGSSNGLICFSEPSISDPVYVCNPLIGEYMTLPLTINHPDLDIISGFGFDATTGKYKVIRMVYICTQYSDDESWYILEAEIHTLGSSDWRKIGLVPYPPRDDKPGLFLNGAIHWMCDSQLCPEEPFGIVCFNIAGEEFSILPPPNGYGSDEIDTESGDGDFFDIRVLKGQLCYFDRRGNHIRAWFMKQYGVKQSWTRALTLSGLYHDFHMLNSTEGLPGHYEAFIHVPSLVSLRDDEEEPAGGPEGYFKFEQWSKDLCAVPSPVCPHLMVPSNCAMKNSMYSHAYARIQSSKDVEHLIRYENHEALASVNRDEGSTSTPDQLSVFQKMPLGHQPVLHRMRTSQEVTLEDFCQRL